MHVSWLRKWILWMSVCVPGVLITFCFVCFVCFCLFLFVFFCQKLTVDISCACMHVRVFSVESSACISVCEWGLCAHESNFKNTLRIPSPELSGAVGSGIEPEPSSFTVRRTTGGGAPAPPVDDIIGGGTAPSDDVADGGCVAVVFGCAASLLIFRSWSAEVTPLYRTMDATCLSSKSLAAHSESSTANTSEWSFSFCAW